MSIVLQRRPLQLPAWLSRLGVAGFLFFLAKGLLWLALPWVAALLLT
ncbi:hypothetical protein [Haliea sp. E17]